MSGSVRQAPLGFRKRTEVPREPSAASKLGVITSAPVLTCVTVTGLVALVGVVGADARWLAALGAAIAKRHAIPVGVPFASEPTAHWHNAIALAELVFHWLESAFGDQGLMLAQLVAVAIAVIVLMRDARAAGATPTGAGAAVLIASIGALGSLVVARAQLFSLALFPLLMMLLRSEARSPSWRIWLALPMIALWSNLHSGVLIGVGAMLVYLALVRFAQQPWTAIGAAAGALVAVCVTPAGPSTLTYYRGLFANQAAARGDGLWAPLSLSSPLDIVLVLAAIVLVLQLCRAKPPLWELVVSAVLALATIHAGRTGLWLLLFIAVPAAPAFRSPRWWEWVMPPLATLALIALVVATMRGPLPTGASPSVVDRAIALAHGSPILADDVSNEQVALAGGRIWVGNPIDAFSKHDQSTYLDWVDGYSSGLRALGPEIRVVVTTSGAPSERLMSHDAAFVKVRSDRRTELYVRR